MLLQFGRVQRMRSLLLYHRLPPRQSNKFWMRSFRLNRSMPEVRVEPKRGALQLQSQFLGEFEKK